MALPALFSRRKRQAERSGDDVYQYDNFPENVRVQIIHIVRGGIGRAADGRHAYSYNPGHEIYQHIVETLREEQGVFYLSHREMDGSDGEYFQWLLEEKNTDRLLDGVELGLRAIDVWVRENDYKFAGYASKSPDDAIAEFNERLAEAAIGYQYESRQIIRMDSKIIHAEVVRPALQLLADPRFSSSEKEYLAAHAAYRQGDFEGCLVECAKAFESTLKVIAAERRWKVSETATAKHLLDAAYTAGFVEKELQSEFSSLRSLLESAVPTVRNKLAAHGAGTRPRKLPRHLAAFQLHQTASAIIFLADHHKSSPRRS